MPIHKAITPVEFANDLKGQLEKISPARILKDTETPRTGWLVVGDFFGSLGVGRSFLALHVRITDVDRATVYMNSTWPAAVVSKADMERSGPAGSVGRHTSISWRIYLTLSANPYRYGERAKVSLPE
jgi:hypothetical protein